MKCLVKKKAILHFAGGREVTLMPGIQDYHPDVISHWAFGEYADVLEIPAEQPEQPEQPEQKGKSNAKKQSATDE